MALTSNPKRLFAPAQLTNSLATYYTSTGVKTIIDKLTLTNNDSSARTVDVHIVPNGGSASATNKFINAVSINAASSYACPEIVGHVMESGEFLQMVASANTAISARASGREVTGTP